MRAIYREKFGQQSTLLVNINSADLSKIRDFYSCRFNLKITVLIVCQLTNILYFKLYNSTLQNLNLSNKYGVFK